MPEELYASGMALTREQQQNLWATLKGCGCTDEWLRWYWNRLVADIGNLKPVEVRTETRDVHHHHETTRSAPGGGFDPVSFATGLVIGNLT